MTSSAIIILNETSIKIARQVQMALPSAIIYGLASRTVSADRTYDQFGELVRDLFINGTPIIGICASGILIRTVAPLLQNKWQEPPLIAIAEDGSAVVPLLGGLQGVNDLARQISVILRVDPAITTSGEIRFQTTLLNPPKGYHLVNHDQAKGFIADLLSGKSVKLRGNAPWLENSQLKFTEDGELTIVICEEDQSEFIPSTNCLIYQKDTREKTGKLTIVGIGPGSREWMSPQVYQELLHATDWVGYKTYLDLVEHLRNPQITRHESDNRVELIRAENALNLAKEGKSVVIVSSGDAGIYGMAAAVFEVLDHQADPKWQEVEIKVCPGISAMQGAAALVGAPLGHDFCVISLSNILKPWEVICDRINLAAQADLAIAFYNPVSKERTWQLEEAKAILLKWRKPETPIVLAKNLGRSGQKIIIKSLIDLRVSDGDMRTLILIGSSQTRLVKQGDQQWLYTPRHYDLIINN